jgi:hypothetical protein
MGRQLLAVMLLAAVASSSAARAASGPPRLPDLNNRLVDPFETLPESTAVAFLFVSVDCPISNRYAPEIRRLHDQFVARGVSFRLVYPNPAESAEMIRKHLKEYDLPPVALRDPKQELAKFVSASITPEAAVFDRQRARVYLGRIDDRYVSLGVQRPAATQHDLEDALTDTIAGRRVHEATTQAVGCFIADFSR